MRRILPFAALALLIVAGCAGPAAETKTEPTTAAPSTAAAADVKDHVNAEGKLACPIMHVEIASKEAAKGVVEHGGVRYYLCCDMCVKRAKEDPSKLAQLAAAKS